MTRRYQQGLSLIELMVALVLGLVITLGVMNIFLSARTTYVVQNTGAAMQEDARYLLSRLSQEIRMVGMFGCLATVTDNSANQAFSVAYNKPLTWKNDSTGTVLTVTSTDVGGTGTTPTWTILSDCLTSATATTGAAAPAAGQQAFRVRQTVYTFKNNALYTGVGDGQQVLISNVRSFELRFGLAAGATDTAVTSYATTVDNPARIRSVRLSLTLMDPSTAATTKLPDQAYSVVATLRNRLP